MGGGGKGGVGEAVVKKQGKYLQHCTQMFKVNKGAVLKHNFVNITCCKYSLENIPEWMHWVQHNFCKGCIILGLSIQLKCKTESQRALDQFLTLNTMTTIIVLFNRKINQIY